MTSVTPPPEGTCEVQVHYRPVEASDVPWILSSWMRTYERSNRAKDAGAIYWEEHHEAISRILVNPDAEGWCAVVPENPGTILGWIVFEPGVLHYVHVKEPFRRAGLGRDLIKRAGAVEWYTHRTRSGEAFILGVVPEAKYNPYRFGR